MDTNESDRASNHSESNDGTNRHGKSKSSWGLSTAVHAVHGVGFVAKKVINNRLTDSLWHSKKSTSNASGPSGSSDIPDEKLENHPRETINQHDLQPSSNVEDDETRNLPVSNNPTHEREITPLKGRNVNITVSDVIDKLNYLKDQDVSNGSTTNSNVVEQSENAKPTDDSHVKSVSRWPGSTLFGSNVKQAVQHRWPSATSSSAANQSESLEPSDSSSGRLVNQHRWPGKVGSNVLASRSRALTPARDVSPSPASLAPTKGVKPSPVVKAFRPLRASRGVSPSPATTEAECPSPTIRESNPVPPARGVSPTPTTRPVGPSSSPRKSHTLSTVSDSPETSPPSDKETSFRSTRELSPKPARGVSPTHSRWFSLTRATARGASPTRDRGVSPAPATEVSPAPSRRVGPRARDVSPPPVKHSGRRHFFNANVLSVFTKLVDTKKEKNVTNQKDVAQYLELLYNIQVQWQFANASAKAALDHQRTTAEKSLSDVWRAILDLRDSLASKKIDIDLLILQLKLYAVLYRQMAYIDEWASIQKEHESALFATTNDLQARSLSLPITGGIKADINALKLIIFSTMQVLHATVSCIQSIPSKLEKTHVLASELANLALHERALLDECEIFLASAAPLHIEECSLRSYLIQSNQTNMTE